MERKRILVVDDDRFIRRAVRHLIECSGYDCLEAGTGDEGYQVAMAERPDLILLDVMLPKTNGYEVSRMIKQEVHRGKLEKDIPIFIVTARRTDSEEREEFLRTWSQADEFIYKPFDLDFLAGRIRSVLESEAPIGVAGRAAEPGTEVTHVEEVHSGD
jgi:DNA-binding response OmpR family regulator